MKQDNYTLSECNCQDISILETEIEKRFRPKKEQSVLLAGSYRRLGDSKKAERVKDCGSWLEWLERSGECVRDSGKGSLGEPAGTLARPTYKLYHANFCRERLCPMCSWRRSYKIFGQMSQIMNYLGNGYRYVFLTLTIPNCEPEELNKAIDDMLKGWHRLVNRKAFKQAVKGFFRALEVTRNKKNGTYHPHFHVVLAVLPSYFSHNDNDIYITRDEWLHMWQQSMQDDSITQVDVRIMRNKKTGETFGEALNSAVCEAAKYAVKSGDYIFANNFELMDYIVSTLSSALSYRRLTALGGVFKDAQAQLGLDDCEDGDLVHVDNNIREDLATMILRYKWSAGAYKLVQKTKLEIVDGISVNPLNGEVIP